MQTLKLHPKYLELAKKGIKRATTRLSTKVDDRGLHLGLCKLVSSKNTADYFPVIIDKLERIKFGKLPHKVAEIEGFSSLDKFKEAIVAIYPNIEDDTELTIIHFY